MKILVTGTAGFIGFNLAQQLLKRGDEVVGLDNINDYYDVNLKYNRLKATGIQKEKITYNTLVQSETRSKYKFIKLDLEDLDNMKKLFESEKFDAVCNLAAQAGVRYSLENPNAYIQSNIVGFINILECCRHFNVSNLSYASSSSVYGSNKNLPFSTSDNVDNPVSLYAASKKSNELMAHTYSHLFGIATTGLRFFTVYGPWGRPDMALFLFTEAILKDESINVFNDGKMKRDFTYIDDIVSGIIKVIDNPPAQKQPPYKVYNIGNSKPVQLLDFIHEIEKNLGRTAKKNMMPIQPGDVPATWANVDDLMNDLGYEPKTSVAEGIKNFIEWYNEYFKVKND